MLVVRAINASDLDALYGLASQVGTGMTTLKPDMKMLGDRLAIACASFAETIAPEKRDYMFVMEDTDTGRLAGVCAIKGAVGLEEPFYNYRIGTLVHSSRELDVFTRMETLYLSNDLTGSTELCSLFLHPDYRSGNNGKLLSKSRFLFIAQFPQLFKEKLIAEMRESDPALSILVVSSWSTEEIILQALQAGATGYVLKERDDMEMALSIRSVLRGGAPIDPFIARRILHLLQATPPKAEKPSPPPTQEHNPDHEETLTRRESGILQLVAEGLSNREIAERLFLSRHTIECHIKHIYRKLAVSGRTRAVYEARARGLLS